MICVLWLADQICEHWLADQIVEYIHSSKKVLCGGIPQGTKLGPIMFAMMVNDLLSQWRPRAKFVDDLTALEIIPRNSPSMMNFIVDDTQRFAVKNNVSKFS